MFLTDSKSNFNLLEANLSYQHFLSIIIHRLEFPKRYPRKNNRSKRKWYKIKLKNPLPRCLNSPIRSTYVKTKVKIKRINTEHFNFHYNITFISKISE